MRYVRAAQRLCLLLLRLAFLIQWEVNQTHLKSRFGVCACVGKRKWHISFCWFCEGCNVRLRQFRSSYDWTPQWKQISIGRWFRSTMCDTSCSRFGVLSTLSVCFTPRHASGVLAGPGATARRARDLHLRGRGLRTVAHTHWPAGLVHEGRFFHSRWLLVLE